MPASHPNNRYAGKSALVTGAAQGIGRSVALRLAREGAYVVAADRDEHVRDLVREIEASGGRAHAAVLDLEQAEGARALVAEAIARTGAIDVAVHNVGGTIWAKPFWEYAQHEIEREITHSLWPAMWGCWAVVPHMLARGRGSIVNVGSVAVRAVYRVPYGAAKGGVHALTACLAEDLRGRGVRVNCVAPGGIDAGERRIPRLAEPLSDTERGYRDEMRQSTVANTTLGRYGYPDEVASAVCYLASDEASYITGETLFVSGGWHP